MLDEVRTLVYIAHMGAVVANAKMRVGITKGHRDRKHIRKKAIFVGSRSSRYIRECRSIKVFTGDANPFLATPISFSQISLAVVAAWSYSYS